MSVCLDFNSFRRRTCRTRTKGEMCEKLIERKRKSSPFVVVVVLSFFNRQIRQVMILLSLSLDLSKVSLDRRQSFSRSSLFTPADRAHVTPMITILMVLISRGQRENNHRNPFVVPLGRIEVHSMRFASREEFLAFCLIRDKYLIRDERRDRFETRGDLARYKSIDVAMKKEQVSHR